MPSNASRLSTRLSRLRRWLLPRRLDRQIMLSTSLLLGLSVPLFAWQAAANDAQRAVESASLQAKALALKLAVTSIEHLVTQDFASTERLLLRSARFPGVLEIQIADEDGRIVGDVAMDPNGAPALRYAARSINPPSAATLDHDAERGYLRIWEPVSSGDNIGWVRLTYSLAEAERIAEQRLYGHLTDGAILAGLLMTLILLVMRRPLRLLREAASFAGRLQHMHGERIALDHSSVEIEQLGAALNSASANLLEQDIAIQKALKALNTQKSAMDEHSIVSITDVDGRITYANEKMLEITGFERQEVVGKDHRIFNSGFHDPAFFQDMWSTIASGRVWHGEILNRGKHGQPIWLNTSIVPFMDDNGRPYEYVAIRTDITKQKRTEQALESQASSLLQMADHLDELVKQRTAELQQANAELQHLNNIKSEFVSVVSHELRTPLTAIKSFAEILEDDIEDLDTESQKHYLSIINEESDRLGRLINDLLDLQKMDAGKTVWKDQRTDLATLVSSSVDFFAPAFGDKGLELRLELDDGEFHAVVDSDRIKQLLANLLSNALKFTDQGGVTVCLRRVADPSAAECGTPDSARMAEISILDTGVGIPQDELTTVFDHFHQVDSSDTREKGGSGLGLAICKQIIDHHQGDIWVESELGEGSRFVFTIPLAQAGAAQGGANEAADPTQPAQASGQSLEARHA